MSNVTLVRGAVLVLELLPAVAFGLAAERVQSAISSCPRFWRIAAPGLLAVPYAILAVAFRRFRWEWLALYCVLPVLIAWLLGEASRLDAEQRGDRKSTRLNSSHVKSSYAVFCLKKKKKKKKTTFNHKKKKKNIKKHKIQK